MKVSIFARKEICYVATEFEQFETMCSNKFGSSDVFVPFIEEVLSPRDCAVSKIVFPMGPGSFTSMRVLRSIAKGFAVVHKNIDKIVVPSFFTYSSALKATSTRGIIAIATNRGDFYCASFEEDGICDFRLETPDSLRKAEDTVFYESDELFDSINLASVQLKLSDLAGPEDDVFQVGHAAKIS